MVKRFFLVFMTLVIFQIILDGHFAIILPVSVQGVALERFTFSATVRTVVLQIWDCPLLEKLKSLSQGKRSHQNMPNVVRWELNKGKKVSRCISLTKTVNPTRLAVSAADLNLKLMRWHTLPSLNLEILASTRCLLLGAGTLGCQVARMLMEAEGVVMAIPMPGHPVSSQEESSILQDCRHLCDLINSHDAIFLLTDTWESRWLPGLLCASANKSTANRTLDQQCTVTRPGLAPIASAVAVELLVGVLHHPSGIYAKAEFAISNDNGSTEQPLGILPHRIRGSISQFSQITLVGHASTCCTACCSTNIGRKGWTSYFKLSIILHIWRI